MQKSIPQLISMMHPDRRKTRLSKANHARITIQSDTPIVAKSPTPGTRPMIESAPKDFPHTVIQDVSIKVARDSISWRIFI